MQQQDSRTAHEIAIEAKRDGSVMKSIAFLTMVFLPGTAVAVSFHSLQTLPSLTRRSNH